MKITPSRFPYALLSVWLLAQPAVSFGQNPVAPTIPDKSHDAAALPPVTTTPTPLDQVYDGTTLWVFGNGAEFKGAKGALSVVTGQGPAPGESAMKLEGDFTGGGIYVSAAYDLTDLGASDVAAFHLRVKGENTTHIGVQLIDGTGQVHQDKHIPVISDGQWHDLEIKTADLNGKEHWGGANDGVWHGPAKHIVLTLPKPGDAAPDKKDVIYLAEVKADAVFQTSSGAVAFAADFESDTDEPKGWQTTGSVHIDEKEAFQGSHSLVLVKSKDDVRAAVSATSPSFPVTPGSWEIQLAGHTDLTSPDSSYDGTVDLEYLNGAGAVVGQASIYDQFQKHNWESIKKTVSIPPTAVSARFQVRINKETPGSFWVDDFSAAPESIRQTSEVIKRMMFSTAQLGNLLYPTDPKTVAVEVWSSRPLPADELTLTAVIKDYWGAEQSQPMTATLASAGRQQMLFKYTAQLDLSPVTLDAGRYYELHATIARKDKPPYSNSTSFAILPEAAANAFKPEEIPFTSRDWDNRIADFVKLTKRLGVRICDGRAAWNPNPPYQNKLVQADLMNQLGMATLVVSPAQIIELRQKGWEKWDETALRQNIDNFIKGYAGVHPLIINLGNEPHSKGDDIKTDINAYRIVYTEVKKVDPTITVVSTSVGPDEDYFKAGLGQWCDAYDFHTYENPEGIKKILGEEYPALFKKYGFPKPIWATEMGLNSQGMNRYAVATSLYQIFANFFAGGGVNGSWFDLLYPDPAGDQGDSNASSFNVFDCRYSKYAPKLDAIAYYNVINAVTTKKFVEEKTYDGDGQVFLFRDQDGNTLQLCYKGKGREDVFIPLADVQDVQVIRIDGSATMLQARGRGITLTLNQDPLLLLYKGGPTTLPDGLGKPAAQLGAAPDALVRGQDATFDVALDKTAAAGVDLKAQPFWKQSMSNQQDGTGNAVVRYTIQIPEASTIREADMTLLIQDASGKPVGELAYRPSVTGAISMDLVPVPALAGQPPAAKLTIHNHSAQKQQVSWNISLTGEQSLVAGKFGPVGDTSAYFSKVASGSIGLDAGQSTDVSVPLAGVNSYRVYHVAATVKDDQGRSASIERPMGGFVGVPRAEGIKVDGILDEPAWQQAPVQVLDQADQYYVVLKKLMPTWKGPQDLSAKIRFLWDDTYLYMGVEVTDDIRGTPMPDDQLWNSDGLQLLVDPMRATGQTSGKYDYAMGVGVNGPKAWCHLSGDSSVKTGLATDIQISAKYQDPKTGNVTYEVAIPWKDLAPFKPVPGADLGLTVGVNDDDGAGRASYMTWFASVQTKAVGEVGDLILEDKR